MDDALDLLMASACRQPAEPDIIPGEMDIEPRLTGVSLVIPGYLAANSTYTNFFVAGCGTCARNVVAIVRVGSGL